MARFPHPKMSDVDRFEDLLSEALASNSPGNIASGLTRALRFIEDRAEDAGLDMSHINNATSTANRAFLTVAKRLREAEEELAKLRADEPHTIEPPREGTT